MTENPWIVSDKVVEEPQATLETAPLTGPANPQDTVMAIDVSDRLRQVSVTINPTAWIVGAHGGSAETTFSQLLLGSVASRHQWPISANGNVAPTLLVARTHMSGLLAAQRAAMEWASGSARVAMLGLVLVDDAPGRRPRSLTDFAQVVAGGFPRNWRLPWVESWRLGGPVDLESSPKAVQHVLHEITSLINPPQ